MILLEKLKKFSYLLSAKYINDLDRAILEKEEESKAVRASLNKIRELTSATVNGESEWLWPDELRLTCRREGTPTGDYVCTVKNNNE